MTLFDAYLMVDWSASAARATGADSIWWALIERRGDRLTLRRRANPPYRAVATTEIADALAGLSARGRRVLVGFDFPFGYPAGFAARHGNGRRATPRWRATWDLLADRFSDAPDNRNDRFAEAARLNRQLGFDRFPFWGHPPRRRYPGLSATKPEGYGRRTLPERRLVETCVPRTQPVWKLAYTGSVGSQALLGIPRVRAIRRDPRLRDRCRVWPFETGLAAPDTTPGDVVLAEVYPSLAPPEAERNPVKDARQVRTIARRFARLDGAGRLAPLFVGDPSLSPVQRRTVEREEAWILGVTATAELPA